MQYLDNQSCHFHRWYDTQRYIISLIWIKYTFKSRINYACLCIYKLQNTDTSSIALSRAATECRVIFLTEGWYWHLQIDCWWQKHQFRRWKITILYAVFGLNLVAEAVMDSFHLPKTPFIICRRAIKCWNAYAERFSNLKLFHATLFSVLSYQLVVGLKLVFINMFTKRPGSFPSFIKWRGIQLEKLQIWRKTLKNWVQIEF